MLKRGIEISQTTVAKYMPRGRHPPARLKAGPLRSCPCPARASHPSKTCPRQPACAHRRIGARTGAKSTGRRLRYGQPPV